jgi:hypothetical protein
MIEAVETVTQTSNSTSILAGGFVKTQDNGLKENSGANKWNLFPVHKEQNHPAQTRNNQKED